MIRSVTLPKDVPGRLYLHSMPGRYEPFDEAKGMIAESRIGRVVCLAPPDEVRQKSPEYARATERSELPWAHQPFEVRDFDAPDDREAFWKLTQDVAARLRSGEAILIHCGAGIGRTGMLAICVLVALGMPLQESRARVSASGSAPERLSQEDLIRWVDQQARVGLK